MQIENIKEGSKKSLIIKEMDDNDYKLKMVINNSIAGLAHMQIKTINNKSQLSYELTDKISLREQFSRHLMMASDIKNFISELNQMEGTIKPYLLDINNILLDVDNIYYSKQTCKYEFIYVPNQEEDMLLGLRKVFSDMLDFINHNDRMTVKVAYGLQKKTSSQDFTIKELLELVEESIKEETVVEQVVVNESQGNKCENEPKRLIDKIISFFRKNKKYKALDDIEESTQEQVVETDDYVDEDATMLLTGGGILKPIVLKSVNLDKEIIFKPLKFPCVIGKSARSCDLVVDSPVISRVHARIIEQNNEYYIEDLNSTNHTYLNDVKINSHEVLRINEGDQISFADSVFIIE